MQFFIKNINLKWFDLIHGFEKVICKSNPKSPEQVIWSNQIAIWWFDLKKIELQIIKSTSLKMTVLPGILKITLYSIGSTNRLFFNITSKTVIFSHLFLISLSCPSWLKMTTVLAIFKNTLYSTESSYRALFL